MMTKKKKISIIIITAIIMLTLLATTFSILYFTTDMFKSNKKLFFKYFGKNYDNIFEVKKILEDNEYNQLLNQNKYNKKANIEFTYTDNIDTTSENTDNDINNIKLQINSEIDKQNNFDYKEIKVKKEDEENLKIEYMKNNDEYGIKFSDLFNQYITLKNNNLNQLIGNLGYSQDSTDNFPDIISLDEFSFSQEELQNIDDKYITLLNEKIPNEKFSKKSNQAIVINDQNISANEYKVTLTKEELNNIFIDILETLKEDELIINKLKSIKFGDIDLSESFKEKIEDNISDIKNNNIGNDECDIIIYECNGNTVSTVFKTVDYEMNFDKINTSNEKFYNIIFLKNDREIKNYMLKETNDNISISIKNNDEKKPASLLINSKKKIKESKQNKNIDIEYKNDISKLEIQYKETITLAEDLKHEKEFDESNSININNLNDEKIEILTNKVSEQLNNKINELSEKISFKDLENVLKGVGLLSEKINFEINGVSDAERNRFNSKFEMIRGENFETAVILHDLDIIQDSIKGIQVDSNSKLKIEISNSEGNSDIYTKLKAFIEGKKDRKYNLSIEYDDIGLVKYVVLEIVGNN